MCSNNNDFIGKGGSPLNSNDVTGLASRIGEWLINGFKSKTLEGLVNVSSSIKVGLGVGVTGLEGDNASVKGE